MFWYMLVKLQPREAMCMSMDYFQPFYLIFFSLIFFFFFPLWTKFLFITQLLEYAWWANVDFEFKQTNGWWARKVECQQFKKHGTIGVCLSSFEYTWSLPLTTYIHLLNCKFLMWNVSLNMNSWIKFI
jgi:hypothetical protein